MSQTSAVIQAMQYDQVYDSATLSTITRIDQKSVENVLHLLAKSQMITEISGGRFRKDRKYKTKQKQLF